MVAHFPDANVQGVGPQAIDERYGDYNFAKHICYVGFRSTVANEAWARVQSFAADYGLGTYDPNSDDERSGASIHFPDGPDRADVPERVGIRSFFGRKR